MKLKTLVFAFLFSILPAIAVAGSGHDHGHSHAPVNQATATGNATQVLATLVKKETLEKSWASITASSVEKKTFKGNAEWVAVFVNETITDPAKQKLYIFLTLGGEYIAANYTGE